MEKLLDNATRILEEEWEKAKTSDNVRYKEFINNLLKLSTDEDTPLGRWSQMFVYMAMMHRAYPSLAEEIDDICNKLASMATEMGF